MEFKFCPHCGNKLNGDFAFCPYCGNKFEVSANVGNDGFNTDVTNSMGAFSNDSLFGKLDNQLDGILVQSAETNKKFNLAKSYCARKRFDEAIEIYESIIEEEPLSVPAYVGIVKALSNNYTVYEDDDIEDAIDAVKDIVGKGKFPSCDVELARYISNRTKYFEDKKQKEKEQNVECKIEKGVVTGIKKIGNGCLIIPNNITSIGIQAFENCTALTSAIIPNGVIDIGWKAFYGCTNLENISMSSSVISISSMAFSRCTNLKSITIPSNVTIISYLMFSECNNLISVTLPNSVTLIEKEAFYGCSSLKNIVIPSSVTEIESAAFMGCSSLLRATLPNNLCEIKNYTFNNCKMLENIDIPNSVRCIGARAFGNCVSIRQITIPQNLIEIDHYAFAGCDNIKNIVIPNIGCTHRVVIALRDSKCYGLTIRFDGTEVEWRDRVEDVKVPFDWNIIFLK